MNPERVYRVLVIALALALALCILWIACMLLHPVPRVSLFTNATLVWEGMRHGRL